MKLEKEFFIVRMEASLNTSDITITGNIKLNKNEKLETYWNGKYKAKLIIETEEPILDEAERKYLSDVIRPFRDEIKNIQKYETYPRGKRIIISLKDNQDILLPALKKDTMYKGMEIDKEYTLEDLGL